MRDLRMSETAFVSGGAKQKKKDGNGGGFWSQFGGVLADDALVAAGIITTVSGGGPVAGAATLATAYKNYRSETPLQRAMNSALINPMGTMLKWVSLKGI